MGEVAYMLTGAERQAVEPQRRASEAETGNMIKKGSVSVSGTPDKEKGLRGGSTRMFKPNGVSTDGQSDADKTPGVAMVNDVDKLRGLFARAFEFWVLLTLALWWVDRLPGTVEAVLGILVILFWLLQEASVRILGCREIAMQRFVFDNADKRRRTRRRNAPGLVSEG